MSKNKNFLELIKRLKDTPFYAKSLEGINVKGLEDIDKLPFTTKQDLRNNYPFGLVRVSQDKLVRIHSSSGTSGKPTVVAYTQKDMDIWNETLKRSFDLADIKKGDILHNTFGYGLFTGGLGLHEGAQKAGICVVPSSAGFSERQLMLLQDFKANAICGTPSFVLHLAQTAIDKGLDPQKDFHIEKGLFGAEPSSEILRKKIADLWGLKYFEIYGLSEIMGPGVASACRMGKLHIFSDHFHPEIIDPKTLKPLPNGEFGELVITTLTKEAMPLLRYRTGDITAIHKDKCECGCAFETIESIKGRSDDMLIINGVNIFPSQIEYVLGHIDELSLNYRIIVSKKGYLDKLEVVVEVDSSFGLDSISALEELKKRIQSQLLSKLYINAQVKLVEPRHLQSDDIKVQRIIDKRNEK